MRYAVGYRDRIVEVERRSDAFDLLGFTIIPSHDGKSATIGGCAKCKHSYDTQPLQFSILEIKADVIDSFCRVYRTTF